MTVVLSDRLGEGGVAGFRIEAEIWRGGMATVYRAQHPVHGTVALKVLQGSVDPVARKRFLQECEAVSALEHPNIVPIYESGETDGLLYIAMPYISGGDLRQLLHREGGPIPPERAVDLLTPIASALDRAHADGLVHRDVKPANILVEPASEDQPEHVYLADFGLAKLASATGGLTRTREAIGSFEYAPPEHWQGPTGPGVDARSDVYMLGCVLYECLTGDVPFIRDSPAELMHAHLHDEPPHLMFSAFQVPPALEAAIMRALAKSPDQRYPSCTALMQAASAALAQPLSAAPAATEVLGAAPRRRHAGLVSFLPSRLRRRWVFALVAGAGMAGIVIGTTGVISLGRGGQGQQRLLTSSFTNNPPQTPGTIPLTGVAGVVPAVTPSPTAATTPGAVASKAPAAAPAAPAAPPAPASPPGFSGWTKLSVPGPSPRFGEAMVDDPAHDHVVLFGGNAGGGHLLADTWTWNGRSWTVRHPSTSPPARAYAQAAYDQAHGTVVLYGGSGASGLLADTWTWNGSTWTQKTPISPPGPRRLGGMAYLPSAHRVVLFGGSVPGSYQGIENIANDTWSWDGSSWAALHVAASPPKRTAMSLVYDPLTGRLIFFGGYTFSPSPGLICTICPAAQDTWTFDGATWTELKPPTSPSARGAYGLTYDAAIHRLVLFGGSSNPAAAPLGDTWLWDGRLWSPVVDAPSPPARAQAGLVYDTALGRLLLFGGTRAAVSASSPATALGDSWR